MFDIGWQELFIVAIIGLIVIGPKELPRTLKVVTGALRKLRTMAAEFQDSIDEVVREADLDDIKNSVTGTDDFDVENRIKETLDPTGDLEKDIVDSLEDDFGETEGWDKDDEYYSYEGDESDVSFSDKSQKKINALEELNKPAGSTEVGPKPAPAPVLDPETTKKSG